MRKMFIIMMSLICAYGYLSAHRNQNMANVTIHNNSSTLTLTIPTHGGAKTIKPYATETFQVQRGQSYDINASTNTKNAPIVATTSEKFTPGKYEVKVELDPASSDPNAMKITVTKPGLKKSYSY
jgi:hypothetical protein